ncbi:MAG TPA: hypothetical protein PKC95_00230 [Thauera aminoaromatica]|nr:hypothetical protein [Thauera aminoaromatica]
MAKSFGILGQSAPGAASLTTVYTAPALRHATVRVLVCNRSADDTFRIAVSPAGASIDAAHYVAYDQAIAANDSASSVAFTVTGGDLVRVFSTNGALSFSVTGIEDDN